MLKTLAQLSVLTSAVLALPACGTNYGKGCEKAQDLTAPWTDTALPIDDSKTRVCESSSERLKLRTRAWTKADEAQDSFKSALEGAGYMQEKCTSGACYYDNGERRISVQPIKFKTNKVELLTVSLREMKSKKRG